MNNKWVLLDMDKLFSKMFALIYDPTMGIRIFTLANTNCTKCTIFKNLMTLKWCYFSCFDFFHVIEHYFVYFLEHAYNSGGQPYVSKPLLYSILFQ